jgi:nucleoid DNA-binding protein
MTQYVQEKLENGKNVNIRGFGAFVYDINTGLPKIATRAVSMSRTLEEQRLERKHIHKIRLAFVPDSKLKAALVSFHERDQLNKPKSQASVYQKGFASIFCNPVPIAAACFLGKDVVESTLNAIFSAVIDLASYGYSLDLRFGFAAIRIAHKDMRVSFKPGFCGSVNTIDFETKMRQSDMRTSEFWSQSYTQKWAQSR